MQENVIANSTKYSTLSYQISSIKIPGQDQNAHRRNKRDNKVDQQDGEYAAMNPKVIRLSFSHELATTHTRK